MRRRNRIGSVTSPRKSKSDLLESRVRDGRSRDPTESRDPSAPVSWHDGTFVLPVGHLFFPENHHVFMLLFFNVFSLFFEHLHLKNHHSLNAIGQSVVAVLVTEYYTHYSIAIIMYHSNRKSHDKAALDPSLINY